MADPFVLFHLSSWKMYYKLIYFGHLSFHHFSFLFLPVQSFKCEHLYTDTWGKYQTNQCKTRVNHWHFRSTHQTLLASSQSISCSSNILWRRSSYLAAMVRSETVFGRWSRLFSIYFTFLFIVKRCGHVDV